MQCFSNNVEKLCKAEQVCFHPVFTCLTQSELTICINVDKRAGMHMHGGRVDGGSRIPQTGVLSMLKHSIAILVHSQVLRQKPSTSLPSP